MAQTAPPLPDPAASTRPRGAHSSHPVVVCCHGPESSEAVQFAGLLAAGTGQPLVVAAAYRYEPAAASARVVSTRGNTSRFNDSDRQVQQAVRSVPDRVEVHRRVVPALSIAAALIELAEEEGACAVVVGRDMHGDVARSVIQGAHCLVVITPYREPLPPATPFRRIGVGLDGSPGSHLALLAAMQLAACVGASVRVIDVGAQSEGAELELAAAAPGVTATFERLDGDPAATLLEATRELDLLICGTRGRGRVLTKVLGSVSAELIEGAHCAVALVPPSVRHRASAPLGLSTAHAQRVLDVTLVAWAATVGFIVLVLSAWDEAARWPTAKVTGRHLVPHLTMQGIVHLPARTGGRQRGGEELRLRAPIPRPAAARVR